jgi:glycerol kinase
MAIKSQSKTHKKYVIALDQGTTSSRAVLFNKSGKIIAIEQQEFKQIFPKPSWVEHNAVDIWKTQLKTAQNLIQNNKINPEEIAAIGITNQRETTIIWDKKTGVPIHNAIVWQDRRTASICEDLKSKKLENYIRKTTGLVIDSYFSATKIKWLLDNVKNARKKAENSELIFGTIDTWLLWNLTGGKSHATDYTNASRTMIFDIKKLCWDKKLLRELNILKSILPEVKNSSDFFGVTDKKLFGTEIPITGIIGDQQAALFAQNCFEKGDVKNTYGTGCFMLMNTGDKIVESKFGLISTIAYGINGKVKYALEGSVFVAGALIKWLRDDLKIIHKSREADILAAQVADNGGVVVVPAFTGLGAPHWDMKARGAIFGLTRGTSRAHIARASLEAVAFQNYDLLQAMMKDSGIKIKSIKVDGGMAVSNFLMQFQSDILNAKIERPKLVESTALGAALMAGIHTGFWKISEIKNLRKIDRIFTPKMETEKVKGLLSGWVKAVGRVRFK